MAISGIRRRERFRASLVLSAAVAAFGLTNPQKAGAQTYTYTGPSGTTAVPTSGNFSPGANWSSGTAPTPSTTTVLDFLDTSSSGYTATDDIVGGFLLNNLVLGNNTANTDTIAANGGSSLSFAGTSPYVTQNGSGTFVINAPIGINPSDTLTFGGTGTGTVTVSGSIGGGAGNSVTVAGANTVVFSAANSFAGALTINSGVLNIQNNSAISGSIGYVNTGATLQLQNNITESAPLQLQGTGASGQNGAVVNVSGTNTISGNITFASGTTNISADGGTLIFSGASFNDPNALVFGGSGNGVFSETSLSLSGGGTGITKVGSGTWYFATSTTSFSQSLHLNAGTVSFVTGGLGTGFINPGGGVLQWAAGNTTDMSNKIGYGSAGEPLLFDTNGNNVTFASSTGYNNTGGMTKYGAGALIITGNYPYTGGTTISGGTLQIGSGGTTGTIPSSSAITDNSNFTIDLSSNVSQGSAFGTISGSGSISQNGGGITTLSANNTYTGTTTINDGTLQAGNTNAFGNNSDVTLANVANTALNITGYSNTLGSLAGGGNTGGNVVLGSNTLTVGADNASTTYAGAISGSGILAKSGTGTLTLTGSSSYTGNTNVNAGIVDVQSNYGLGAGTAVAASGASLQITGGLTLSNAVNIAGVGASGQDGALVNLSGTNTVQGALTVTGGGASTTYIGADAGTLILAGGFTGQGNTIYLNGAGNGVIANSGAVNLTNSNIYKEGTGDWYFLNTGITYQHNLHLDVGTITFANGGLGTAPTINFDGPGGVLQYAAGNTEDMSGFIQYGGGSPIAIDTNGNNVTFAGTLANNTTATGLTKYGAGALILSANTVYGASNPGIQTKVLGGSLVVNGSTPAGGSGSGVSVGDGANANSGVLAGTGTIGAPLTVKYGGTITAGSGATSADSIGTLHTNSETWNSGGAYVAKVNAAGTSNDELIMSGLSVAATSGSPFNIDLVSQSSTALTNGQKLIIGQIPTASQGHFSTSDLSLTLSNVTVPSGDTAFLVDMSSGGNDDLVVEAAPEPTSLILFSAVVSPLLLARRQRRCKPKSETGCPRPG